MRPATPSFLYAVLLLDLDRFKIINDSLGHLAGDQLLVAVSERLRNSVRFGRSAGELDGNHIIARLGGDEFAVLLEELDRPVDASITAKRIQRRLQEPFLLDRRRVFSR